MLLVPAPPVVVPPKLLFRGFDKSTTACILDTGAAAGTILLTALGFRSSLSTSITAVVDVVVVVVVNLDVSSAATRSPDFLASFELLVVCVVDVVAAESFVVDGVEVSIAFKLLFSVINGSDSLFTVIFTFSQLKNNIK